MQRARAIVPNDTGEGHSRIHNRWYWSLTNQKIMVLVGLVVMVMHLWSAILSCCSHWEPTYTLSPVTMRLEDHQSSWPTAPGGARRQSLRGCGSRAYAGLR